MKNIIAFVRLYILAPLVDRFLTQSVGSLIAQIKKIEAKIEASIAKGERDLAATAAAEAALSQRKADQNTQIDAAYKLLHSVTEMTR